jgi:4-amino-4-deoxy-L-arabinose transferase-like glycosyltransferase
MKWWHIFLIALGVRLLLMVIVWSQFGNQFYLENVTGDSAGYMSLAQSIVEGRGFQYHGIVSALRTPMYAMFLSVFYFLHLPLWFIPLVQNILGSLTAVLLFIIGSRLFSARAGIIAGLLWAFEPYNVFSGNTIMSETLFIFLLILSFYCFTRWFNGNQNKIYAITGFVLGLTVLTRPIAPFFLSALFLFFFFLHYGKKNLQKNIISGCVFIAIFCITVAPWLWRNYKVFGVADFTPVTVNYALYSRIVPMATVIEKGISPGEANAVIDLELAGKFPNFTLQTFDHTFDYVPELKADAIIALKKHWPTIITNHLKALVPGVFVTGWGEFFNYFWPTWNQDDPWLTGLVRQGEYGQALKALGSPFKLTLLLGGIGWAFIYWIVLNTVITKRKNKVVWILLTFAVLFILLAVQPPMNVRYRMTSFPFLFLLFGAYESRFKIFRSK